MITLKRLFSSEYNGESVIITRTLKDRVWETTDEFFPYTDEITHSRAAVVMGNGLSRLEFKADLITQHHGGFEGEQRLETYACNAALREVKTDYLIITSDVIANEATNIVDQKIFANANRVVKHSNFNLTPQNPLLNAGAMASYLAAFNGHKKIFLLGFDGQDTPNYNNNIYAGTSGYDNRNANLSDVHWTNYMRLIFDTYYDTQFVRVMPSEDASYPETWKYCLNYSQIDFRRFVIVANL